MPYLIFDIETVVDGERILRTEKPAPQPVVRPGTNTLDYETREEMIAREVDRLCKLDPKVADGSKSCFIPARYQSPVVICLLLVNDDMSYMGHWRIANTKPGVVPTLPEPDTLANTQAFWAGFKWACDNHSPLVLTSFGGANFDMPVLEANALEAGIQTNNWFVFNKPSYQNPRLLAGSDMHLDLSSYIGQSRGGSLSFWSRLIGLPGKLDTTGAMVAEMLKAQGGLDSVIAYCSVDLLNTYGLLFETKFVAGLLPASYKKNPIFEDVMNKVLTGLGPEANRFIAEYHSVPGIPL